ncbi:unnamed protein product [Arabidopsis lyrata]|uniref:Predicted protein n=2 Tax=Arabidopsis TaxID=3701 RepID=D7MV35_ARALL|nr:predicted protein [Arabidopsis lyrata subsp. lyrata]KAG7549580.1 hypothetical protein ISN45_Aa06g004490 [Arabidopsis thaliana x Arabidopsis arenosa]CAH8280459.1 unnamed protein product [Arabidopsis lyrata]
MVGTTPAINTLATPTQPGSLANEFVPGNVYGSNMFASLDSGVTTGFEMDDFSLKTRGGRSIKPTKKIQEMQWTMVGGRGKRGRGGRGGHG